MKYFVIATRWNDEKEAVKCIVGEFDRYLNAIIFRDAYNKCSSDNATIVKDFELLNQ